MADLFSKLTDEQLSIQRNCAAFSTLPSMRMRIIARAGTGKTTSLEAIVMKIKLDACTEPNICYAAFNKTTETEFGERIHKKLMTHNLSRNNMEARTLHSLCYQWYIASRNNEYQTMKENIETDYVMKYFDIERYVSERFGSGNVVVSTTDLRSKSKQQRIKFEATWIAELILKTLDNYLNSASVDVTDKHLPYHVTYRYREWTEKFDEYLKRHRILRVPAADHYSKYDFKNRAMALYQQALAGNEAAGISMTHSIYQKFAQLSNAILTSKKGQPFDMYLVDEAQDLNECQCALITRQWQNGATIALVGDPAQSIYQFRGACRQFERWEVDNEETLTQSFRFGKQIARLCNVFLGLEKLWLLSLKTTIEAKGVPVKKEYGVPESAVKEERTPGTVPSPFTQPGGTQLTPGAPVTNASNIIKALVRGLPNVVDKWIDPSVPLSYPHTVICRTNNSTYYALLAGIQEAERQEKEGNSTEGVVDNTDLSNTATSLSSTHSTDNSRKNDRKRGIEDVNAGNNKGGKNSSAMNTFDLTVTSDEEENDIQSQHKLKTSHNSSEAFCSGSAGTPAQHAIRKFYINGVRSFEQLENGLMRRIEQLASISVEKPYLYKGEQYTNLDAVKGASLEMEDIGLLELVEITEQWGGDIERIKELIKTHYASSPAEADVLVTTVHKSKGLEWDSVALGDDIGSPLGAQPLYTIQCNTDPATIPAGQEPPPPRFIVGLELNSKIAFSRINHMLSVGEKVKENEKKNDSAKQNSSGLSAVKPEPGSGLTAKQSNVPPRANNSAHFVAGTFNKLDGRFRDSLDEDTLLAEEVIPTATEDYPPLPVPPVNGQFCASVHNTLVPLLPSTIALGQRMQQGVTVVTPGVAAPPVRANKCPLICCIAKHLSCADRVRQMYYHELAERRRLFGQASVCGLERDGEGVSNYRLVFSDQDTPVSVQSAQQTVGIPIAPFVTPKDESLATTQSGAMASAAAAAAAAAAATSTSAYTLDPFLVKFSNRQNANEWYVAVSRAKLTLRVNSDLSMILEWIERDIGGLRTQLQRVIGVEADPILPFPHVVTATAAMAEDP